MKKNNKLNKGFTLVETLVALSIFTVSLLGIMSILASSIFKHDLCKQKITASYLAQEGVEYVRNMRDTNVLYDTTPPNPHRHGWDSFKTEVSTCDSEANACKFDISIPPGPSLTFSRCVDVGVDCQLTGSYVGFTRKIWVDESFSADEVKFILPYLGRRVGRL